MIDSLFRFSKSRVRLLLGGFLFQHTNIQFRKRVTQTIFQRNLLQTRENRLVSVYPTREYLITSLNASCYIPMYSMGLTAPPPELDGQVYGRREYGGIMNGLSD